MRNVEPKCVVTQVMITLLGLGFLCLENPEKLHFKRYNATGAGKEPKEIPFQKVEYNRGREKGLRDLVVFMYNWEGLCALAIFVNHCPQTCVQN